MHVALIRDTDVARKSPEVVREVLYIVSWQATNLPCGVDRM